jgi:4'-phosphopantetheinyl transferase EntD
MVHSPHTPSRRRVDPDETVETLRALLSADVAVAGGDPEFVPGALRQGERIYVERAVSKRQREFARGRWCARRALEQLGVPPATIPVGAQRQPVWPDGVVGSITHCDGFVAAAVCTSQTLFALGIDVEPRKALPVDVRSIVLTANELGRPGPDGAHGEEWDTVAFCAKEAIHKCINPSTGVTLDFLDVEVDLLPTGEFRASLVGRSVDLAPVFDRLQGRYGLSPTHVAAVATIQPLA